MKKRFCALILLFALVFTLVASLSSCGEKYEPVESTAEEKRTVMQISYDGEKYEVRYELYRALFLELKPAVDGGNSEVWSGADKDKYVKAIDELIYQRIAEIYAIFHMCEKADINVYSSDFDDKIEEIIESTVDSDYFGGNYDKYLASLKEMNHNYATQELMLRYELAREALASYYMGGFADESLEENAEIGQIKYTKDDVKKFYFDEEKSRQVIIMQLDENYTKKERAVEIRNTLASKANENDAMYYIGSIIGSPPIEVIGKYSHDKFYYSDITDAAFSLELGQASEVITLRTDDFDGYAIVYRIEKTEERFEDAYSEIVLSYIYNEFGRKIEATRAEIAKAIAPTDTLSKLDRSKVTMN